MLVNPTSSSPPATLVDRPLFYRGGGSCLRRHIDLLRVTSAGCPA